MNYTLTRNLFAVDGIMGELTDAGGNKLCDTLEHSYASKPKLPAGNYVCKRGLHQLHSGPAFSTFEVTGVEGHAGILFHVGNTNKDSEGCILVGDRHAQETYLLGSRNAFEELSERWANLNEFSLTVLDATKGA